MSKSKRSSEKESFWRLVLEEHGRSRLSVREFCSREGLSTASFYVWKRSLQARDAETSAPPEQVELIPVEVVESIGNLSGGAVPPPVEVVTPSGYTLRFPSNVQPQQLTTLLAAIANCQGRVAGC